MKYVEMRDTTKVLYASYTLLSPIVEFKKYIYIFIITSTCWYPKMKVKVCTEEYIMVMLTTLSQTVWYETNKVISVEMSHTT